MPYYRRRRNTFRPRRPMTRNRRYRRRFSRFRPSRRIGNPHQKVFYYKRNVDLGIVNTPTGGTGPTFSYYSPQLTNVPNYTEFTALYDSYQIKAVKYKILPLVSQVNASFSAIDQIDIMSRLNLMRFYSAIDYNGTVNLTSINQIREYGNCKTTPFVRGHRRYFKQKVQFNSSLQTPWKTKLWVNVGDPSFDYSSTLILATDTDVVETQYTGSQPLFKVEATYYMAFKSTK